MNTVESEHDNLSRETKDNAKELGKKKDLEKAVCWLKGYFIKSSARLYFWVKDASNFFNQNCWFQGTQPTQLLFRYSGSKLFEFPNEFRQWQSSRAFGILMPISHTFRFIWCGFLQSSRFVDDVHNKSNPITFGIVPRNNIDSKFTESSSKFTQKAFFARRSSTTALFLTKKKKREEKSNQSSVFQWLSWLFEQAKRKVGKKQIL